ncbi:MAG: polyphosphate kinase 1, partial [Verrucomicrobiota bacterium]
MPIPYINRELSWVEFNQRVLNEALRDDLPLLERVKFLAITASNLDEFFQVRIGGLIAMKRGGIKKPDLSGLTPTANLNALRQRILRMSDEQYALFNQSLIPALRKTGVLALGMNELNHEQSAQALNAFEDQISPLLTPLAIDPNGQPPAVPALQMVIACRLIDTESESTRFALITIPDSISRLVPINAGPNTFAFVLVEDLVAAHADQLFPGEKVAATTAFRVTRNGDIAVQEEDATDLADEMEEILSARRFADTVRLEIRTDASKDLARVIQQVTAAGSAEIYRIDGPPGLASFMELVGIADFDHLRDADWPSQSSPSIIPGSSMFETIASGDLMLFHPYESFEPVLRLLEEAANDPDVIAIKQVLYRTAKKSRIIKALDRADELQRAGAQIVYGVKGLKTHAKICMIVRRESGHLRRYVHLGTGNYNETTSRLYTDISYLTCKADYGNDASLFFNAVTGRSKLLRFQRLIPAPTAMKPMLLDLISGEAERARQG